MTNIIKAFNQEARTFHWIKVKHQYVLLALLRDFQSQIIKEIFSMPQKHPVRKLADQIALLVEKTVVFVQT